MATLRQAHVPSQVEYPASDGQPMAETDTHWVATADLTYMLKDRYRDADDVYVASDNFVYYEEGNPSAVFSPDVYVVFGVPKHSRRVFKLWEEQHAPAVVFEISSRQTWLEDKGNKMAVCAMLGVTEYYLFDPESDYLDPPLQGFRLEEGQYVSMAYGEDGSLRSEVLGLTLAPADGRLALTDTQTGERLLSPDEAQAARRSERRARRAERSAREAAEEALQAAEVEVSRLRAELEHRTSK